VADAIRVLLINDNVELMCRLALLRLGFGRLLDKLVQRIDCQSHAMTEIVTAARTNIWILNPLLDIDRNNNRLTIVAGSPTCLIVTD
jgi:hypothetical protein